MTSNTQTTEEELKEQVQSNIKDWTPNQFNYAASTEEMSEIMERVAARFENEELVSAIKEGLTAQKSINMDDETAVHNAVALSLYMHTAYEIGRENALTDIDSFIANFLEAKKTEQEMGMKETSND